MIGAVRVASVCAHAERRVTTASSGVGSVVVPDVAGAGRATTNWAVGIQPGYPSGDLGLGWPGSATRDHAPRSSTTVTGCPNRAWLSTRPLRPRRPAVVSPLSQPAGLAGAPIARTSRGRGDSGEAQSVATETAIRAWLVGVSAPTEPVAGDARASAARTLVTDAMRSVRSPEVMGGTVGRSTPIVAEAERGAPQAGFRDPSVRCLTRTRRFGHVLTGMQGVFGPRARTPSHGVDHVHAPRQQSPDRPRRRRAAHRRRGQGARGDGRRGRVAGPHTSQARQRSASAAVTGSPSTT